jgi:hypothetical protein
MRGGEKLPSQFQRDADVPADSLQMQVKPVPEGVINSFSPS